MSKYKKRFLGFVMLTAFLGLATTLSDDFEIAKNLELFSNIFRDVNVNYVDEIDPEKMMEGGLNSMLSSLDPYSAYIPARDVDQFQSSLSGHYAGMGAAVVFTENYSILTEVYENSPAQKAGLRAGDKLISADGKSLKGLDVKDVSNILRGSPGSKIKLEYQRPGIGNKSIEITRQEVYISNVPYYGMLENGVAYLSLITFTENAGKNIANALMELKQKNKVNAVVLDLRGNSGGLLNEAVNVAAVFLPKGTNVVSIRGREKDKEQQYKTINQPIDTELPIAILIDNNSASAAEIVAGAIQDYDRGIIIGKKSFGKGLVQSTRNLPYGAKMKFTTSRYYLPSGRCIQSSFYKDGKTIMIGDDQREKFKTEKGRIVLDGAGIFPDISTMDNEIQELTKLIKAERHFFDFAVEYIQNNKIPAAESFSLNNDIFESFVNYLDRKNFNRITETEKSLSTLDKKIKTEGISESVRPEIDALKEIIRKEKLSNLTKYRTEIVFELQKEISLQVHLKRGSIISSMENDPDLKSAKKLLVDLTNYRKIINK